jgi:murein DD-endopeptidase MepM/ murein hydrolase activator NlpD
MRWTNRAIAMVAGGLLLMVVLVFFPGDATAADSSRGAMSQPTTGRVTSKIGYRCGVGPGRHHGIDIANHARPWIHAAYRGRVTFTGWRDGFGKLIVIRHPAGYRTRYAHVSRIRVRKGQMVTRGQVIGRMGQTGDADGPHLHFEVRHSGHRVNINSAYRCGRKVNVSGPINYSFPGLTTSG